MGNAGPTPVHGTMTLPSTYWDPARLEQLRRLYADQPFEHGFWSGHVPTIELDNFRGQFHYLGQHDSSDEYTKTYQRLKKKDAWNLLGGLHEDCAFGVTAFEVDGVLVSRDLLDSVDEIYFLREVFAWQWRDPVNVLDIGAGYGRFAHRLTEAMPNAGVVATDAIAESTWLCEGYLDYRCVARAVTVPYNDIPSIPRYDVATAIHVWPECRTSAVRWWADLLSMLRVRAILFIGIADHTTDGDKIDHILKQVGYNLSISTTNGMFNTLCNLYKLP